MKIDPDILNKLKAAFASTRSKAKTAGASAKAAGAGLVPGLRSLGESARSMLPKAALSVGAGLGMTFGPQMVQMGGDAVEGVDEMMTHRRFERSRAMVEQSRRDMLLQQMQEQRLQAAMQLNEMRLQQLDPHLYAELQAGRRLARGAVPIGGNARRDLIEEVTRGMSQGQYSQPQPQSMGF